MTARPTRISTDVDFDKDGKQVSNLYMPWSMNDSAYKVIHIPIACIKNGPGPTMLFTAGTHGDEYEGQIGLLNLLRELEPDHIQGRVIILPAANFPAAMAGQRMSPYDGGNLNRAFPGDPDGGPTAQIAYYTANHLVPLANAYHDLHAGGRSLDYLTYCGMHLTANEELNQKQFALVNAFGPPISIVGRSSDDRLAQRGAHVRGIPAMGGEFGGRAAVSRTGLALVERGLRNTLAHLGILKTWTPQPPKEPTRFMQISGRDYFVYAPADGLFEPYVELGDWVEKDQPAGRLHFVEEPMRAPIEPRFKRAGLVVCKRAQGRAERGDCVAHLATDFEG